jgi:hypothetical protein
MDQATVTTLKGLRQNDTDNAVVLLRTYLERVGFPTAALGPLFDQGLTDALRSFQRRHGVPDSGIVDNETALLLSTRRCSNPDIGIKIITSGRRWPRTRLTYGFRNYTGSLSQAEIRSVMREATRIWSSVTPLRFRELAVPRFSVDIEILFALGDHGDGSPFDGAGGPDRNILAHAFFPPPSAGTLAGDIHFDDAQPWSMGLLLSTALHELGHSLGLEHSSVSNAVMFANLNGATTLHADDVKSIQSLYPFQWQERDIFLEVAQSSDETPTPIMAVGDPCSYLDPSGRSAHQHVIYRGEDNGIHELAWNPTSWQYVRLFDAVAGRPVDAASDPFGYVDLSDRSALQHVFYRGIDGHIHELSWNPNSWAYQDLFDLVLANTGHVAVLAVGEPHGYIDYTGKSSVQHVFYRGVDGHIHELAWSPTRWEYRDLFVSVQGPDIPVEAAGDPFAYIDWTGVSSLQHVFYRGIDGHIHEFSWKPSQWEYRDLFGTIAAEGRVLPTLARGEPCGFIDGTGRSSVQHVFYRDIEDKVTELAWNPSAWESRDLITSVLNDTGVRSATAAGDPSGFVDFKGFSSHQHLFFRSSRGHLQELAWSTCRWETHDVTEESNSQRDIAGNPSALFDHTGKSSPQHVFIRSGEGTILEFSWIPPLSRRMPRLVP